MIDLTQGGLIGLLSSSFALGANWALKYYLGPKNGNGTRAMKEWQSLKESEVAALRVAIQSNAAAISGLDAAIKVGILPRLENLERQRDGH